MLAAAVAIGEQAAGELQPGSTTQLKLLVLVVVQPRSDQSTVNITVLSFPTVRYLLQVQF